MVGVKLVDLTQENQKMEENVREISAVTDNESNEMVNVEIVPISLEQLQME